MNLTRAILSAALLIGGCSNRAATSGGLIVTLTPNSAYNSIAELIQRVDSVQLIVDAPQGFTQGTAVFQLGDPDDDGRQELLFAQSVDDTLPVFRLLSSATTPHLVELRVNGYDTNGAPVASGALDQISVRQDGQVALPFNLLGTHRRLRVISATPLQDETVPARLNAIQLLLSRPLPAVPLEPLLITTTEGEVWARPVLAQVIQRAGVSSVHEELSLVTFAFCEQRLLAAGAYELVLRSIAGVTVDQNAATSSAEPFSLSFFVAGEASPGSTGSPCLPGPDRNCASDDECDPAAAGRYACTRWPDPDGRSIAVCRPRPPDCTELVCPTGAQCVGDRPLEFPACEQRTTQPCGVAGCEEPNFVCNQDTGRCDINPACPYTPCRTGDCNTYTGVCDVDAQDCRRVPILCDPVRERCDDGTGRCVVIRPDDCLHHGCGAEFVCNRLTRVCERSTPCHVDHRECAWPFYCHMDRCVAYDEHCWSRCISTSACDQSSVETPQCRMCLDSCVQD